MKLASYVWEVEGKNNESLNIKWDILKKTCLCNIRIRICKLYQEEKLVIMMYPEQNKLLNEILEVMMEEHKKIPIADL